MLFDPRLNPPVLGRLAALKLVVLAAQLAGLRLLRRTATSARTVQVGLMCFAAGAFGAGVPEAAPGGSALPACMETSVPMVAYVGIVW